MTRKRTGPSAVALREDDLRKIQEGHFTYCHSDQTEDAHSKFMAEHGHPCAAKYRKLRKLFDSLQFASSYGERYIAFQDAWDFARYRKPALEVSTSGIPYTEDMDPKWDLMQRFHSIYPSHELYPEFLEQAAKIGWPKKLRPELRPGVFELVTSSRKLVREVSAVIAHLGKINVQQTDDHKAYYFGYRGVYSDTYTGTMQIWRAITRHYKPYLLNHRTAADDEVDMAPLPLHAKKFTLGYGSHVVVDEHYVVIPKIPLDKRGGMVLSNALFELERLCEQGYPWQGDARDWVEGWAPDPSRKRKGVIPMSELRRLDKKFKNQRAS
jgi:hypothetical protein